MRSRSGRRDADSRVPHGKFQAELCLSRPADLDARTLIVTSPLSVNLIPFPARLSRTCRRRTWSPTRASGTSGGMRQEKADPFSLARTASTCVVWSKIRRRLNGADSNSSFPASIFAESKQIVQQGQQQVGRSPGGFQEVLAVGSACFRQRQIDHAQDGVHGRAQLMADVGQELALGLVGGLGGCFGLPQFPFATT